jgi:hypothetical protein
MIQKQQAEQSKAGLQINLEYKLLVNPLEGNKMIPNKQIRFDCHSIFFNFRN